jgi:energy-coupling factor transport system permease protein
VRYRRRASPLHAARPAIGALWCVVLSIAALATDHPLGLVAVLATILAAAALARVGRDVLRAVLWGLPLIPLWALINALVYRGGVTVFARLGEVPPFGQVDMTAEAAADGAMIALRVLTAVAAFVLLSAAVDPDGLLRVFRRVSLRSALAAALAVRLVPVLAADARRLDEARRCGARPAPRLAVLRAVATGALDRALDVAATLEVRGYAGARRVPRSGRPLSRHDVAFLASTLAIVALVAGSRIAGLGGYSAFPEIALPVRAEDVAPAAALAVVALLPFADRRGIEP